MTTQITHVYRCPDHKEFDRDVPFGTNVPQMARCPVRQCGRKSPWVPQPVAAIWRCPK